MIQGIDVSKHNTITSWVDIKNSGKDFVFLRLGWINSDGTITKDVKFEEFYEGATSVGLNIGVYVFSYLKDVAHAQIAAKNTLTLIKGKTLLYPIVFDYENADISKTLSKSVNTEICKTYLAEIQVNKYFAMLYTYTSFIQSYLNITDLSAYALWIADYRDTTGTTCKYTGTYSIWQFSGSGKCNGVVGACDLDVSKVDYTKLIKKMQLNGYVDNSTVAKNETVDTTNKYGVPDNIVSTLRTPMTKNVITTFNYKRMGSTKLSAHFFSAEFLSKNGLKLYSNDIKIHNKLIEILEALYAKLNCSKIIINSGYRTSVHEIAIGGNANGVSYHTKGQACDFMAYGSNGKVISSRKVCCALQDMGILGIAYISETSVHVDTRTTKWWYDEKNKKSISSFHEYFKM